MSRAWRLLGRALVAVCVPVVIVALWWTLTAHSASLVSPPLSSVWTVFRQAWLPGPGSLLGRDLVPSLVNLFLGLVIAVVLGVAVGVAIGSSSLLWLVFRPSIELARACPVIVLFPIVFSIFGLSIWGKVVIIAFATLWPVLLNTIEGVRSVDPLVLEMARSYRLSKRDRTFLIVMRSASPQIISGIRVGVAIAVTMLVASEYFASDRGIGFYVLNSEQVFDVRATWAGTILLGLLGYILSVAFAALERVALSWQIEMRSTAQSRARRTISRGR